MEKKSISCQKKKPFIFAKKKPFISEKKKPFIFEKKKPFILAIRESSFELGNHALAIRFRASVTPSNAVGTVACYRPALPRQSTDHLLLSYSESATGREFVVCLPAATVALDVNRWVRYRFHFPGLTGQRFLEKT